MNAPLRKVRPYVFWGQTTSLCETCLGLVPAKIVDRGRRGLVREALHAQHGVQSTLVSTDAAYWRACKDYSSRATAARLPEPHRIRLPVRLRAVPRPRAALLPGADRDQRALQPHLPGVLRRFLAAARPTHLPLATIERMLDALVASEGEPDLVQISGGEPTLHPEFFDILDAVRRAADPPRDAQHQRHPHRAGAGFRRAARRAQARARGLSAVRFARARRADGPARRRPAPRAPARRWRTSSGTASRPRWW